MSRLLFVNIIKVCLGLSDCKGDQNSPYYRDKHGPILLCICGWRHVAIALTPDYARCKVQKEPILCVCVQFVYSLLGISLCSIIRYHRVTIKPFTIFDTSETNKGISTSAQM